MSLLLRHHPEAAGLSMDPHGWIETDALIEAVRKKFPEFNKRSLDEIVSTNDKKRFSFNEDETKIRARQGHSVDVDVNLKETVPPEYLWHGTADRFLDSIRKEGLRKMNRLYVHLSPDAQTAVKVGKRHGRPVILMIDAAKMHADGYVFYLSENGVWLTDHVPAAYIIRKDV